MHLKKIYGGGMKSLFYVEGKQVTSAVFQMLNRQYRSPKCVSRWRRRFEQVGPNLCRITEEYLLKAHKPPHDKFMELFSDMDETKDPLADPECPVCHGRGFTTTLGVGEYDEQETTRQCKCIRKPFTKISPKTASRVIFSSGGGGFDLNSLHRPRE